jgi:hypothetical protein
MFCPHTSYSPIGLKEGSVAPPQQKQPHNHKMKTQNKNQEDKERFNELHTQLAILNNENRLLKSILEQLLNIELIPKLKF